MSEAPLYGTGRDLDSRASPGAAHLTRAERPGPPEHLPTHRYEIMNYGSNSGHFWRDFDVLRAPEHLVLLLISNFFIKSCQQV